MSVASAASSGPVPAAPTSARGMGLSVMASALFAGLYLYATWLQPLSGTEIFGWRLLLTVPVVSVLIAWLGEWPQVSGLMQRVRQRPMLLAGLALSSALLGVQLWLFMWAPLNGLALEVSLGYFLMPLVMVLAGRLLEGERLSPVQGVAVALAALGATHEVWRVGGLSWASCLVALGYPAYFVWRRRLGTDHLGGMWFDMLGMWPVALWILVQQGHSGAELAALLRASPALWALVPLLAVISAAAFLCYLMASRLLPMGLFGLMSYLEPVLMVGVSMALGERIGADEWFTYGPIWAAVAVLVWGTWREHRGVSPA